MHQFLMKQIVETLRNGIDDPLERGEIVTDTENDYNVIDDYTIELSEKRLKNIYFVKDHTKIDDKEKYLYSDFHKIYDDPKNDDDYPKIEFKENIPTNHNYEIKYHSGSTWIYPDYPIEEATLPRISVKEVGGGGRHKSIGRIWDNNYKVFLDDSLIEVMVWCDTGTSVFIDGEYYSGGKLKDYLATNIRKLFEKERRYLSEKTFRDKDFNPVGRIDDIKLDVMRDLDIEFDDFLRKELEFDVYLHEYREW